MSEKCEHCGKTLKGDEVQTFQGVTMCKDCLEEKTVVCSWCNNRIWNEDNYGNGSVDLCQNCYDNHYTNCERCGRLIHYDDAMYLEDDGDPYCENCYELEQKYQVIHDYNYKPEPILQNYNTVEFRIFRGTLKYETFIATLQLVHQICNKAIDATDKEFETMTWSDFVKDIDKKDKPELINYLKSKELYMPERITVTSSVAKEV